jgi:hypothetical protein
MSHFTAEPSPSPPGDNLNRPADASADSHRRRPVWRLRFAAICLGIVVGLACAELMVRLLGMSPPRVSSKKLLLNSAEPATVYHCYPSNPNGEFQAVPETTQGDWQLLTYAFEPRPLPLERLRETPWCVQYRYSSKQIRDREYDEFPPPGVVRIAMVGDSFVFGEGVPEEKSLPRQLHALLGDRFEVINGGQMGANTIDEAAILSVIAAEAHCPRAILVVIPNDVPLTARLEVQQKYINDLILIRDEYVQKHEARAWYAGHSRLLWILGARSDMSRIHRNTIQWYLDSYDQKFNGPNMAKQAEALQAVAAIPNCRTAVVLYPLLEGFETGYPLAPIHAYLANIARRAGLPVLDLAPFFAGRTSSSLWVHPTDHHPNGSAHQLAAQAISDWLRSSASGFLEGDG